MADVNPPPVPKIPQQFVGDPVLRGYFQQIQKVLLQLYIRTGGGDDSVSDIDARLSTAELEIDQLQTDLDAAEAAIVSNDADIATLQALVNISYITTDSNVTVSGNEFIEATDELTVTLTASPTDRQFVTVYHNAGNGKKVSITDGTGTDILVFDQSVISYSYSSDFAQWVRGG